MEYITHHYASMFKFSYHIHIQREITDYKNSDFSPKITKFSNSSVLSSSKKSCQISCDSTGNSIQFNSNILLNKCINTISNGIAHQA